jgi:hypothetical protein
MPDGQQSDLFAIETIFWMYLRCWANAAQVHVLQGDFQQQGHEARHGEALKQGAPGKTGIKSGAEDSSGARIYAIGASTGENEIPARVRKSLCYKLRLLNHETTLFLWTIPEWIGFNSLSFFGAVQRLLISGTVRISTTKGAKDKNIAMLWALQRGHSWFFSIEMCCKHREVQDGLAHIRMEPKR